MKAFADRLPDWLNDSVWLIAWAPPWIVSLVLIVLAVVLAFAVHAVVVWIVRHGFAKRDAFWQADGDGALAASVFHSGAIAIHELKHYLHGQGVAGRL